MSDSSNLAREALPTDGPPAPPRPWHTVRFQLLAAVNGTLLVIVAIFLVYDYRREFAARMSVKQIALEEEAKTLLPGVQQAHHHGVDSVQQYVDAVCARMRDVDSPGHHIAVQLDSRTLHFGRQRLAEAFQAGQHLAVEQTVQHIAEQLATYRDAARPRDDVTLLLVELA